MVSGDGENTLIKEMVEKAVNDQPLVNGLPLSLPVDELANIMIMLANWPMVKKTLDNLPNILMGRKIEETDEDLRALKVLQDQEFIDSVKMEVME